MSAVDKVKRRIAKLEQRVRSFAGRLVVADVPSQLEERAVSAYDSYRRAKEEGDLEAANLHWKRYGIFDDAHLRLLKALQTANDILTAEN